MKLLTEELRIALTANNLSARDADHIPVVKWFTPWSNATWLITEMEPDPRCSYRNEAKGKHTAKDCEVFKGNKA